MSFCGMYIFVVYSNPVLHIYTWPCFLWFCCPFPALVSTCGTHASILSTSPLNTLRSICYLFSAFRFQHTWLLLWKNLLITPNGLDQVDLLDILSIHCLFSLLSFFSPYFFLSTTWQLKLKNNYLKCLLNVFSLTIYPTGFNSLAIYLTNVYWMLVMCQAFCKGAENLGW